MRKTFYWSVGMFVIFVLWTFFLGFIDVQTIGPNQSSVGLATLNRCFHTLTGVHMWLYTITDWLSLIPVGIGIAFAILGLAQWIKRKSILKVDLNILILGGFYLLVLAAYLFFENIIINYRPVLINGTLEASYPSSTTMLVLCIMVTAAMQLGIYIQSNVWRCCINVAITLFTVLMVIARLVSGVHWFTDVMGGILLSSSLVLLYKSIYGFLSPH